jgi:uncharacterized membrane protein YtjA (UPF0391 family)
VGAVAAPVVAAAAGAAQLLLLFLLLVLLLLPLIMPKLVVDLMSTLCMLALVAQGTITTQHLLLPSQPLDVVRAPGSR